MFETRELPDASLFITCINNAYPWYFNIETKYKDIFCSAIVELDINNTIGEFLDWAVEGEEILITNKSFSPCRLIGIILFNNNGEWHEYYLENNEYLDSCESAIVRTDCLSDNPAFFHPDRVFLKYESIEDIGKEFLQSVDQMTSYYRNIVLDFSGLDEEVESAEISIKHISTDCEYFFEKGRDDFNQAINLTLIMKNEVDTVTLLDISRKFRDKEGNVIKDDILHWDYSQGALIDLSLDEFPRPVLPC